MDKIWTEIRGRCVKQTWQENHFVTMLRAQWRQGLFIGENGAKANIPFWKRSSTVPETERTLTVIPNPIQCCSEISVHSARSIALLVNGFLSLFGPGNSVAKWLLLETSTWKLWMAATALVFVMNVTFVTAADALGLFDTDLPCWFNDLNVVFVSEIRITQMHYDKTVCVFSFFIMLNRQWAE